MVNVNKNDFELSEEEIARQAGQPLSDHPFKQGQEAADRGAGLDTNPHVRGSAQAAQFKRGWTARVQEKASQAARAPKAEDKPGGEMATPGKEPAGKRGAKKATVEPKEPRALRGKRAVQPPLIDVKDERDQVLIDQAERVKEYQDERMAWLKKEVEARSLLLEMMHKRGLATYTFDDWEIKVEGVEKVKVNKKKDGDDE